MIIADTSVWIEFFKGNERVFTSFKRLLEKRRIFAVEWVFGELLQGVKNAKERDIVLAYWHNSPRFVEDELILQAGIYSQEKKLLSKGVGLIDSSLLVAAEKASASVWSLDKKLLSVVPKKYRYSHLSS